MHNGNIAFFTTTNGTLVDIGAKELIDNNKLPTITDATLGRVKITKMGRRCLIALPVKERISLSIQLENLDEVLHSLFERVIELQLKTIATIKGPVGDIPWANVKRKIHSIFLESETKIIILKHEIVIPKEIERIGIIYDNHSAPLGRHKDVSKTYLRIREKYYWPNLKRDIQNFVQQCKSYQTKKLVRLKTH
ncbi:uncharacterized protein LOC118445653 [Vespa mandarinia]|uniref:uncharacterized protein LOC118445653 n=1 Tax=Vespa mandarinia TaxID=7446 RepID=UPI00160D1490|nr:uncharacterized protein LOC118445653 [Vespa mandarinia]